jgi:nucleoside-diphosphate-sugar epimerase
MWFGDFLEDHPNLVVVKCDIRNELNQIELNGFDAIIHLASVANDPCSDLNPHLSWETSCLATMNLAERAVRSKVKHFIYASSGSVYGVKGDERVTEDLELVPISEYNKTKMVAERVLMSYAKDMTMQLVRPATVCGFSKRMRLDVAVNLLTMQALERGEITVLGGDQIRPNIHIDDITDLYLFLLDNKDIIGPLNAGFENLSILKIAEMIASKVGATVVVKESNDPRSYRLDSTKLLNAGFAPKKTVENAIDEIIHMYRTGVLKNEPRWHNLKWMIDKVL